MKALIPVALGALVASHGARRASNDAPGAAVVKLALTAYASETEGVTLGAVATGENQIDAVWLSMKELRFREASPCDKSKQVHTKGPVTAELVTGRTTGLADSSRLIATRYCGFELTLRRSRAKADGAPQELRGASILVQGRRSDGVRFLVRARAESTLWLRAEDEEGFSLAEGASRLFLAVDVTRWMAGIDLATAEASGEGANETILIDEKSNTDLLAVFQKNVAPGFGLFLDHDGDGDLGASERAATARLAAGGQ